MVTVGPLYVSWNYTYACNFNCSHCYSRAPSYPRELTRDQYLQVVDQMRAVSVFKVGLGGGEPLIRRDCIEMLGRMADAHMDTNITTNGWLVDPRRAQALLSARLSTLYVSLDSTKPDVHDLFRRRPGSYERVLRAIRSAVGAGLRVKLSTVITQVNLEELADFVALANRENMGGVEFKRFRPAGNGLLTRDEYELQESQEQALRQEFDEIRTASDLQLDLIYGAEPEGGDSGCPCGTKSICIRPNGDVSPCAYSETVIGNLMQQSLGDLWATSPALAAMRAAGGCMALEPNPAPSNPYMHRMPDDHGSEMARAGAGSS